MATMQRRDVLAARADQDVALASESKETILLGYTQIRADGGTQMRAAVNEETAGEYADALRAGATFPPVIVFHDGTDYWLGDGFHRVRAYFMAHGHSARIPAEVRPGTRRDAILHAAAANATHGLRRTPDDKRRAVETLLRDDEWAQWSDREIARRCHVGHPFVGKIRTELATALTGIDSSEEPAERTYTTRHGTQATMHTDRISQANQERAVAPRPLTVEETLAVILQKAKRDSPQGQRHNWLLNNPTMADYTPALSAGVVLVESAFNAAYKNALAEAANKDRPYNAPKQASSVVYVGAEDGSPSTSDAPPVLPSDLVELGCKLTTQGGYYFVSYGKHRDTYASLPRAIAWCRHITGTDKIQEKTTETGDEVAAVERAILEWARRTGMKRFSITVDLETSTPLWSVRGWNPGFPMEDAAGNLSEAVNK